MNLAVVIPTWQPARAVKEIQHMLGLSALSNQYFIVSPVGYDVEGPEVSVTVTHEKLGPLQAMAIGCRKAVGTEADTIAVFHDDVTIEEDDWDLKLKVFLEEHPRAGLIGFGGAVSFASSEIYKHPYRLDQLARYQFMSNMRDAEIHGTRTTEERRVTVLDGFSQIFTRDSYISMGGWDEAIRDHLPHHHMYDAWAACRMAELGYETWLLPIACHHHGGKTATSGEYDSWLKTKGWSGDSDVHARAHEIIYERFRNVLPLRLPS